MRHRISLLTNSTGRAPLVAAAALTLTLALVVGCASKPVVPPNGPAADFQAIPIVGVEGQPSPFSSVLAGRPALVSFWAPWCEPCVRELPALERLSRVLTPCGAMVLGVAVGETPASVAVFARERLLTYPQFTDEKFRLADALGQKRVPTTVVFDRAQHVVFVGEGFGPRAEAALRSALGNPKESPGCTR